MPVVDRETFAPNAAARYAASHATPSSDVASAVARALARQDIGLETSPAHLNGCREDLQPLINRLRLPTAAETAACVIDPTKHKGVTCYTISLCCYVRSNSVQ